ncbi:MAG: undecaprenyldiphospho-muramoylpentapeptide beta-N-acetylglucosaminyltransferase [Bacteroidetes bacterium]|nr:MAG: undecaprenyldiphospho-muramoylpentapeptide beta-N-acetylglucosaminyltransferase [Bacteroidota bacterium]
MTDRASYRILIGGGGTGGHVFPAIAIADALKAQLPGSRFLFVGALGRLEMEKVPEAGYEIVGLPVAGFQRRLTLKNVGVGIRLIRSLLLSRKIIRRFRPDVAVGVGGYASGPILRAASRRGVPVVIQEQNSYAGLTNRLLAAAAKRICVAYENMDRYFPAAKIELTGNPVRAALLSDERDRTDCLKLFELDPAKTTCLLIGGSLGARTLNMSVLAGLELIQEAGLQLIWQCGKARYKEMQRALEGRDSRGILLTPFIADMSAAYGAADVIVSRAGALSISELCIIGKPAVLVPSPNVAEDHQTRNAEALVKKEAAIMVRDADAEQELVGRLIALLDDEALMGRMSENMRRLGIPDAANRIAEEVKKTMKKR